MKKSFNDKYGVQINLIANLLTILGTSVVNVIRYFLKDHEEINVLIFTIKFFANNWIIILILNCIITFVCNMWIVPLYKIRKLNVPVHEAKSSKLFTAFLLVTIIVLICVKINVTPNFAGCINEIENVRKGKRDTYSNGIEETDILTQDDVLISSMIKRCDKEIISLEEWDILTDSQLYYIRNGIFAYEGLIFKSDFYERFNWYNGWILSQEECWELFNTHQVVNIRNIQKIERTRK